MKNHNRECLDMTICCLAFLLAELFAGLSMIFSKFIYGANFSEVFILITLCVSSLMGYMLARDFLI